MTSSLSLVETVIFLSSNLANISGTSISVSAAMADRCSDFIDKRIKIVGYNPNILHKEDTLLFPFFVKHSTPVFDYFIRAYEEKSIVGDVRIGYGIVYFTHEEDAVMFRLSI